MKKKKNRPVPLGDSRQIPKWVNPRSDHYRTLSFGLQHMLFGGDISNLVWAFERRAPIF